MFLRMKNIPGGAPQGWGAEPPSTATPEAAQSLQTKATT